MSDQSGPITIAILGASGDLGGFLVKAIAEHPKANRVSLRILTRPSSAEKAQEVVARHSSLAGTIHPVDYAAPTVQSDLGQALKGVDIVISTVGDDSGRRAKDVAHTGLLPGFIAQDQVAKAAKEAGVKLFVPSEYGSPSHSIPRDSGPFVLGKLYHHDLLRELGLPSLLVYAGMFPKEEPESTPLPVSTEGIPLGEPPFETTRFHVASYITHLLLDRHVDEVKDGIYVIRGLKRDKGIVNPETEKTQWTPDVC
ncbi:hypothetical protein C8J57DRAFT_1727516 [Mycena rebaudengoi]|nr:hypothetical protein C8J57DRAFT_1727516 [Mycena rebaudengoi]